MKTPNRDSTCLDFANIALRYRVALDFLDMVHINYVMALLIRILTLKKKNL